MMKQNVLSRRTEQIYHKRRQKRGAVGHCMTFIVAFYRLSIGLESVWRVLWVSPTPNSTLTFGNASIWTRNRQKGKPILLSSIRHRLTAITPFFLRNGLNQMKTDSLIIFSHFFVCSDFSLKNLQC
ncbi:unnamed protein product, partial [Hymenolepis diminuta]